MQSTKQQLINFNNLSNYETKMDDYYFNRRLEYFKKFLPIDKNTRILDFGCGIGKFIEVAETSGYNTVGFDFSKTLIKIANKDCTFIADGSYPPLKPGCFDFILMTDVIEHLDDYLLPLIEVNRVLKKDGHLLIIYPNPHIVPLLNLLSSLNMKVQTKENKIPLADLKDSIDGLFTIEFFKPIILASKLPISVLKIFEKIERMLPLFIIERIGFAYVLLLKKQ